MKPQSKFLAQLFCLSIVLVGCPSQPEQTPPVTPTPTTQATVPQPPTQVSAEETPKPVFHSAKTVDPDRSGGIRGLQPVTFVIKAADENVEAANVSVLNDKGKPAGSGTTNDWGEFRTSLTPGHYTVVIHWQGERTIRPVSINVSTQEIPLSLTLPNP